MHLTIFKNWVLPHSKHLQASITKGIWLIQYKEIITIHHTNYMKKQYGLFASRDFLKYVVHKWVATVLLGLRDSS
jgi:hypothetical protein